MSPFDPSTYWPARYQKQGPTYVAKGGSRESYEEQMEELAPYLQLLTPGGMVLDFGCGPGRFRATLEQMFDKYVGHDLIPGFGTETPAPVAGRDFDAAIAIFVLQHVVDEADYLAIVRDLYAGLREGGELLVVDSEIVEAPAKHMAPRGMGSIAGAVPWASVTRCGMYDNHWVGIFVR